MPTCFLRRKREGKGVDLDGRRGEEDMKGVGEGKLWPEYIVWKYIFNKRKKKEFKNSLAFALSSTAFLTAEETGSLFIFLYCLFLPLFDPPQALQSPSHSIFSSLSYFTIYWPSFITLPSPSAFPSMCLQIRKIQLHFFMETQLRLFTAKPQCCPRDINDNPIQNFMFFWNKQNRLVCTVFNLICLNYHHSVCNQ